MPFPIHLALVITDAITPDDPTCAWCSTPSLGEWVTFATLRGQVEHWKQKHRGKVGVTAEVSGEECTAAQFERFMSEYEGRVV